MAEVGVTALDHLHPEVRKFSLILLDALAGGFQGSIKGKEEVDLEKAYKDFARWIIQHPSDAAREFIKGLQSFIQNIFNQLLGPYTTCSNTQELEEQSDFLQVLLYPLESGCDTDLDDALLHILSEKFNISAVKASNILLELKGDLNFMINLTDGAIVVSFLGAFGSFFTYAARKQAQKVAIANAPKAAGFVLKHAAPVVAKSVARGAMSSIIGAAAGPVGIALGAISLISLVNQIHSLYESLQISDIELEIVEQNLRLSLVYRTWGKTFIDANKFQEGIESYLLALDFLEKAHKRPHREIADLCKEIANFFRGVDDEKRRQYEAKAEDILRSLNAS